MSRFIRNIFFTGFFIVLAWTALPALGNRLQLPPPSGQQQGQQASQPQASQQGSSQDGRQNAGESLKLPESRQSDNSQSGQSQGAAPETQAAGQPGAGAQGKEPSKSLMSIGQARKDATGAPLVIPDNARNMDFVAGAWNFEHAFTGAAGEQFNQDFVFEANGKGKAFLSDGKDNIFVADAFASVVDDAMRIVTGPFINEKTGQAYAPEYIDCENDNSVAVCNGTDGFFKWEGERLLKDQSGLAFLPESYSDSSKASSNGAMPGETPAQSGGQQRASQEKPYPAGQSQEAQQGYAELSAEGAELSPIEMEKSVKAQGTAKDMSLASLAGNWRFSKDFARRDDGRSLALEFSFDKTGNGSSSITANTGETVKTGASAEMTKNGAIRVRTDAYGNQFFPTFMECRPGNPDLVCDVSNGWTRMENGRLVAVNPNQSSTKQPTISDILDVPQEMPKQGGRNANVAEILSEIPEDAGASSQAGTQTSMVLPRNNEEGMNFLEGRWRCNTGLVRTSDNQPIVVEFSFNKNGEGNASIREQSGALYNASAKASMNRNTLRINTSQFHSKSSGNVYNKCFIECQNQGQQAICSGENGGVHWNNATFTRIK